MPGVADMSSLGGETMQYQVLLDPTQARGRRHYRWRRRERARREQRQRRRRLLLARAASSITSAGSAALTTLEDIGNVVLAVKNGVPVLVKDVGNVVIGTRRGSVSSAINDQNDAVEGVVPLARASRRRRC